MASAEGTQAEERPAPEPRTLAVAFKTFGCKVNRVESEQAAADLLGWGVRIVAEEEAAVVVINTCTVTGEADRKARKAVRHALGLPQAPLVVATGCLAALGAEELSALGERVVVEADHERVAERVAALLDPNGRTPDARTPATASAPPRAGEGFRTRAAVKVADGCDAFCAYCIVPYARGGPRSVPLAEVTAEVERLASAGIAEVVLTGINIGRYADGAHDLASLVRQVAATGVPRIRISSIEPLDLTPALLDTLSATPALCPHLHVPLQSGSNAVLRSMGRSYTAEEFSERIAAARAAIPGLAVTTDVMAGFPGETAEDAAAALEACERIGFSRLHVFRYSKREGTRAAAMKDQVPAEESASRAAALRALDARLRERYAQARVGGLADVLVEEVDPATGTLTGTTGDYLTVRIEGGGHQAGEIVQVRLVSPCPDSDQGLHGRPL